MLRMDDSLISSLLGLLTECLPSASHCLCILQALTPPVLTTAHENGTFVLSWPFHRHGTQIRRRWGSCRKSTDVEWQSQDPGAWALLTTMLPGCVRVAVEMEGPSHDWLQTFTVEMEGPSHDWLQTSCSLKFRPGDFHQCFRHQGLRGAGRRLRTTNCSLGKQGRRLNRGEKIWKDEREKIGGTKAKGIYWLL